MAKARTTITLESMTDDQRIAVVTFVDGKRYKLQHPGNRAKIELEQILFHPAKGMDRVSYLEKAFDSVIIPEGHDFRPDIDNVSPHELEVWERTLQNFLDGNLGVPAAKATGSVGTGSGSKSTGA